MYHVTISKSKKVKLTTIDYYLVILIVFILIANDCANITNSLRNVA